MLVNKHSETNRVKMPIVAITTHAIR